MERYTYDRYLTQKPLRPAKVHSIKTMPMFYNPRRTRDLYQSGQKSAFRLSRSKIENYKKCPQCFYLDVRLGVAQPPGYPFSLNNAVDILLKKEFDIHRAKNTQHPLMEKYGVDAVPFADPKINTWRNARSAGITHLHEPTNFFVTGGVDDVWVNPTGELIIVDYKATSKTSEVNIDAEWQDGYKRQMEIYQWLFRKNGYRVSPTSYFVYANGDVDKEAFDGKLEFDIKLIPYTGADAWVEPTLHKIKELLDQDSLPHPHPDCEYCAYRQAVRQSVEDFDAAAVFGRGRTMP